MDKGFFDYLEKLINNKYDEDGTIIIRFHDDKYVCVFSIIVDNNTINTKYTVSFIEKDDDDHVLFNKDKITDKYDDFYMFYELLEFIDNFDFEKN